MSIAKLTELIKGNKGIAYGIAKFRNKELAISYAERGNTISSIALGDDEMYWVISCNMIAGLLEKMGFEIFAPWSI